MGLSACLIYILAVLVICKWLHWKWTSRHLNRFFGKYAGPKRINTLWTVNIVKYKHYTLQYFTDLYEEFKEQTICWWMGPVPTLMTTDPEFVKSICLSPDLQNKSTVYNPIKKLVKGGLVFISDKEWEQHRKLLNPCFHKSLLLKFVQNFNESKNVAISEINALANGSEQQLDALMIYLTMLTTLDTSFETHLPKADLCKISKSLAYVIKEFVWKAILQFMNLEFMSIFEKTTDNYIKYLSSTMKSIAEQRIISISKNDTSQIEEHQYRNSKSIKRTPKILLDRCIELYKLKEFTFDDIITECLMLLGASFDTTGITLYSVLVLLAMHPDVQERVFEEVESVFPDKDFVVEYEHLPLLTYLEMVINETMRLMPPIVHIARDVRKDTPISKDIILPKGLQVFIPIFHLHRRKDVWGPDADAFNPDRFLPENFSKIHPYAYIPFSKGARNCLGWRYAEIMMRIVLAGLIRNFKYETDFKYEDLQFESGIAFGYKEAPLLRIHKRFKL